MNFWNSIYAALQPPKESHYYTTLYKKKLKMNRLLILFLLFSTVTFSQENKAYYFSLEEAVTFALDSNYTAINARRDMAKALKQKWETTGQGLPQINADIQYM